MFRWFSNRNYTESCIFCNRKNIPRKAVFYEDDMVVAFKDLRPKAKMHILVIPKEHIKTIAVLDALDIKLVKHMAKIGQDLLTKHNYKASQQRFGFHPSPFNSIDHLHLHCLGLPFIPTYNALRFTPSFLGSFIPLDQVLTTLERKSEKHNL